MRALVLLILWSASLVPWRAKPSAEQRGSPERLALHQYRNGSPERLALHQYRNGSPERLALHQYNVRLDTTKGAIVIAVHRDWAPNGAVRFHALVTTGYFDDSRFFRVVKGQWAQFGINRDPKVATAWRERTIRDDPRVQSNTRGRVAFAFATPNGRTTQIYISLRDNSYQDQQGFVPFGEVVDGMNVADALNSEYGETAGGGIRAGKQQPLFDGGAAYLDRAFPRLDRLLHARVIP
jgi:cyclophilin family peptidyl-prolyl cis-trans isomerase